MEAWILVLPCSRVIIPGGSQPWAVAGGPLTAMSTPNKDAEKRPERPHRGQRVPRGADARSRCGGQTSVGRITGKG